jgi:AcrR family transcriptional regulator
MARQLSNEKRQALMNAAVETIATHGVSAATAKIANRAGVAEGTLFKYFPNKNVLLNAVYLALKAELREALLADFPTKESVKAKSRHVWTSYVNWGAANPSHRRAISQLAVSEIITEETKRTSREGFEALGDLMQAWPGLCGSAREGKGQGDFAAAMLTAIADTTIDFIAREPRRANEYANSGFAAFWRAAEG